MNANRIQSIDMQYEIRFWSQIMGDHMRFIINALDISEGQLLDQATILRNDADDIYTGRIVGIDEVYEFAMSVKRLKTEILNRQTHGKVKILLPPTFINHTLNEVDQMISIITGEPSPSMPIADHESLQHKLWLQDAMGHADYLKSNLDPTEKPLRKAVKEFKKRFKAHLLANEEFLQYSNHLSETGNDRNFPRKDLHTQRANVLMNEFMDLLSQLHAGKASNRVLAAFTELVPDHMYREECYYLRKLGFDAPDPTAPRNGN